MAKPRRRGFTLIELVLTATVLSIVALVVARMLIVGLDTYASVSSRSTSVQQGRTGMDRMVNELVRVTSANLLAVADTQLEFRDAVGLITSFRQDVNGTETVVLRGNDLLAGSTGYLDFDYLDGVGATVTTPAAVRRVNIELNVVTKGGYGALTFRTEIFPRTFMYAGFQ